MNFLLSIHVAASPEAGPRYRFQPLPIRHGRCLDLGRGRGELLARTTGDLGAERDTQLPGFYSIGFSNAKHWQFARPGAWNDPDYILIGWIGADHGKDFKKTTLTPNEQYSYA